MSMYAIQPPEQPSLPVRGSTERFPVRRVYCVGRNYAAHTIEMGGNPDREEPFFFQKIPIIWSAMVLISHTRLSLSTCITK